MKQDNLIAKHHLTFENIKQIDCNGKEFWLSRQLCKILEYHEYRNFLSVIQKAKNSCKNSGFLIQDHFVEMHDMVDIGTGATRQISNIKLSRYACYLIVQNGDPSKSIIAVGQTYFAIQTRRQELQDKTETENLIENNQRLTLREEIATHNKALISAAKNAGVESKIDYALFQDEGYKGLYGGLGAKEIHKKKGLKKSHKILDHMGSTELAANLFRTTQTADKLRRENIQGKSQANITHHEIGKKIRQTIQEIGGTMPEELPKPDKSIQQLEREKKVTKEIE